MDYLFLLLIPPLQPATNMNSVGYAVINRNKKYIWWCQSSYGQGNFSMLCFLKINRLLLLQLGGVSKNKSRSRATRYSVREFTQAIKHGRKITKLIDDLNSCRKEFSN